MLDALFILKNDEFGRMDESNGEGNTALLTRRQILDASTLIMEVEEGHDIFTS